MFFWMMLVALPYVIVINTSIFTDAAHRQDHDFGVQQFQGFSLYGFTFAAIVDDRTDNGTLQYMNSQLGGVWREPFAKGDFLTCEWALGCQFQMWTSRHDRHRRIPFTQVDPFHMLWRVLPQTKDLSTHERMSDLTAFPTCVLGRVVNARVRLLFTHEPTPESRFLTDDSMLKQQGVVE